MVSFVDRPGRGWQSCWRLIVRWQCREGVPCSECGVVTGGSSWCLEGVTLVPAAQGLHGLAPLAACCWLTEVRGFPIAVSFWIGSNSSPKSAWQPEKELRASNLLAEAHEIVGCFNWSAQSCEIHRAAVEKWYTYSQLWYTYSQL